MALYYTLPVYKETYDLIITLYRVTKNFPREYKYSIGQEIKRDTMELVRHIYRANIKMDKMEHLQRFIDDFEIVKLQVRLCHDMKLMSTKQFATLVITMDSIGRQITGWKKYSSKTMEVAKDLN